MDIIHCARGDYNSTNLNIFIIHKVYKSSVFFFESMSPCYTMEMVTNLYLGSYSLKKSKINDVGLSSFPLYNKETSIRRRIRCFCKSYK